MAVGRGITGFTHGAETPSNLASITPTAREVGTRVASTRQRQTHKTCDSRFGLGPTSNPLNNNNNINNNNKDERNNDNHNEDGDVHLSTTSSAKTHVAVVEVLKSAHQHYHHQQQRSSIVFVGGASGTNDGVVGGCGGVNGLVNGANVTNAFSNCPGTGVSNVEINSTNEKMYKDNNVIDSLLKASDAVQGRLNERSMVKIEKQTIKGSAIFLDKGKSLIQDKHEMNGKCMKNHVDNLKYYGELKSYGNIEKLNSPIVASTKILNSGSYQCSQTAKERDKDKIVHGDHHHHRTCHTKSQDVNHQKYQETKYSYNVNSVPGTPAQACAAAVFFARYLHFLYWK